MKVYLKRGARNEEERKMESALSDFVNKQMTDNPEFKFEPASNSAQLKKLYLKHMASDATIISETKTEPMPKDSGHKAFADPSTVTKEVPDPEKQAPASTKTESTRSRVLIDPMNRANPIIRDYVTEGAAKPSADQNTAQSFGTPPTGQSAPEPQNFDSAFRIPGNDPNQKNSKASQNTSATSQKPQPNPSSGGDDTSKDNRKRKLLAKKLVNVVGALLEKGIKWWALKDINAEKVEEYQITGEIDVEFIMQLPDGQQESIKAFFQRMCHLYAEAENDPLKEEKKQELVDALVEYMKIEDITPSPAISLLLAIGDLYQPQITAAFTIKMACAPVFQYFKNLNSQQAEAQADEEEIEEVETEEVKPTRKKRKPSTKKK